MIVAECPSHVTRSPEAGGAEKRPGATSTVGTGVDGAVGRALPATTDKAALAMLFHIGSGFSKRPSR